MKMNMYIFLFCITLINNIYGTFFGGKDPFYEPEKPSSLEIICGDIFNAYNTNEKDYTKIAQGIDRLINEPCNNELDQKRKFKALKVWIFNTMCSSKSTINWEPNNYEFNSLSLGYNKLLNIKSSDGISRWIQALVDNAPSIPYKLYSLLLKASYQAQYDKKQAESALKQAAVTVQFFESELKSTEIATWNTDIKNQAQKLGIELPSSN